MLGGQTKGSFPTVKFHQNLQMNPLRVILVLQRVCAILTVQTLAFFAG